MDLFDLKNIYDDDDGQQVWSVTQNVGPVLTEFQIDRMAFGQPERTCLNIQNVPLL